MAMGVLRRLLEGGLLTDESNARHRKQKEMPKCPCGASPAVLHLSWCCPLHDDLRQPLFQLLGHNGDVLPACTRYATLVPPAGYAIPLQHIQAMQRTKQRYIRSYKQSISNAVQVAMQSNPAVGSSDQYEENGHVIGPRPGAARCVVLQMWSLCPKTQTRAPQNNKQAVSAGCPTEGALAQTRRLCSSGVPAISWSVTSSITIKGDTPYTESKGRKATWIPRRGDPNMHNLQEDVVLAVPLQQLAQDGLQGATSRNSAGSCNTKRYQLASGNT